MIMSINEIIAQIVGLVLIALTLFTPQAKSRKGMLFVILLANILSCVQFFFVGATAGLYALIVTTVRSVVYWYCASKGKRAHISIFILFVILQIGATVLGWSNWRSTLTLILLLNTYGQWQTNNKTLRICLLFSSLVLGIYCFHTHAYTGAINKWLQTSSAGLALYRFRKQRED